MNFHFQLMIYPRQQNYPKCLPAATYIAEYSSQTITWTIDLNDATFDLTVENRHYVAPDWNFGRADWLAPQLRAAAQRLEQGEKALLRSAVIEGMEFPYLAFDPHDEAVAVYLFVIPDVHLEGVFPAGPFSGESATLYQYVFDNLSSFFESIEPGVLNDPEFTEYFSGLIVPRLALIERMYRAAEEADQLFSLPGLTPPSPILKF